MSLYLFSCGRLRMDQAVFDPRLPRGSFAWVPVPFYLYDHPRGLTLIDTGVHPRVVDDPAAAWHGVEKAITPAVAAADLPAAQLQRLGVPPEEIRHVVCTHLHMDHAGGNQLFPRARFYVQQAEWDLVQDPAWEGKGYFAADWRHPLDYHRLSGEVDLFGDGRLRLVPTPGHTPGHWSVILTLPHRGTVVLAVDAAPLRCNVGGEVVPKNALDRAAAAASAAALAGWAGAGALTICGHDPEQWAELGPLPATLG